MVLIASISPEVQELKASSPMNTQRPNHENTDLWSKPLMQLLLDWEVRNYGKSGGDVHL